MVALHASIVLFVLTVLAFSSTFPSVKANVHGFGGLSAVHSLNGGIESATSLNLRQQRALISSEATIVHNDTFLSPSSSPINSQSKESKFEVPLSKIECPFETQAGENPCFHEECITSDSPSCVSIVQNFCSMHPQNRGCKFAVSTEVTASHLLKSCPFETVSTNNPCFQVGCNSLDGAEAQRCRKENVIAFCLHNPHDSGCIFVNTRENLLNSCPFTSMSGGNPCYNAACKFGEQNSKDCRSIIMKFCTLHKYDPGCTVLNRMRHPGSTPSPSPRCPFSGGDWDSASPCHAASWCVMHGLKSRGCTENVMAWCKSHPYDEGCMMLVEAPGAVQSPSPSSSPSSQCPFSGGDSDPASPCHADSWCMTHSMKSRGCADTVLAWCKSHSHDEGCIMFVETPSSAPSPSSSPSSRCPFSGGDWNPASPCHAESWCMIQDMKSRECSKNIVSWCKSHSHDDGCMMFVETPSPSSTPSPSPSETVSAIRRLSFRLRLFSLKVRTQQRFCQDQNFS